MWEEKLKSKVVTAFTKALDERVSYSFSNQGAVIFRSNWIFLVLFDNRLDIGENKRRVMVCDPISGSEFITSTEKTLSNYNPPIKVQYEYAPNPRHIPFELPLPSIEDTIDRIKSELPLFVDAFIKQIKRNNEYLSPKIEFTA